MQKLIRGSWQSNEPTLKSTQPAAPLRVGQRRLQTIPKRRGAAMVEMAVCLPVFMLTLMGIIEFGRAMSVSQLLNAAAREGCRSAILDGSTNTAIETLVKNQVAGTVGCATTSVTVAITVNVGSTTSTRTSLSSSQPRDTVTVNVTVPYSAVTYAVSRYLEGKNLRGACAMTHE